MGYYSEVAIAMKKEDYNKMVEDKDIKELVATAALSLREDIVIIHFNEIKWDTIDENIAKFEDYMYNELIDSLKPISFVRVGEAARRYRNFIFKRKK